jgi:hypothetical protein
MDKPTIREAVALFDDPERLEQAVSDLCSHGFDHADLSLLAPEALSERPIASARQLANDPATPRTDPATDTDIRQGRVLATGMAATIAGFAAAGLTVATGGVLAAVIAAGALAAGGAAAIGTIVGRKIDDDAARSLDAQLARGGVLLWAHVADMQHESTAVDILRRYSTQVAVHEYPADPRLRGKAG